MTKQHDQGELFTAAFGQVTPAQVLADAESQGITPQDYARDALRIVAEQGGDVGDLSDAYGKLCADLGVAQ